MSELPEYALSDRDRKKMDNARLAMTRGNWAYTVEICFDLLIDEPNFLEARKLLRKAQRRVYAAENGRWKRIIANVTSFAILPIGYLQLRSNPARAMFIGEKALNGNAYNARALSLVARGAQKLDLHETEAFCLESICDRFPNNAVKLERLCEALIKVGSTEKALAIAERLTFLRPSSGHVQELVKSASVAHSINRGKWEDKDDDFRSKLKNREESDSLERANRVSLDDSSSEARVHELIAAIHQDPQRSDNYKLLVRAFMALERYSEALEWLEKAFALPEMENDASLRQLRSELKVNRVERELFDLKRDGGVDEDKSDRISKLERELLQLKLEESRKLVEQFPNDYSQRFKYGSFLLESGTIDAAIQQFQVSQRSPSLRIKSLVLLGRCFMEKKLYDLALEQLKQATQTMNTMDDFKKEVLYLLAQCFEGLNQSAEAFDAYKTIYASDIGYRDVAQKIDSYYKDKGLS